MSPRRYQLGLRQADVDQTRARIVAAARELLATSAAFSGFTIDAVARQADVARMTIYYQFGSKIGLLEALCDALAAGGGMERLAGAFQRPDPLDGLAEYIRIFGHFWESDRLVTRRLRALAALDPDLEQVIRARDERRRHGVQALTCRIAEQHGHPDPTTRTDVVDVLFTLLSFEVFDTLAGPSRSCSDVVPIVLRLAHAALGIADPATV